MKKSIKKENMIEFIKRNRVGIYISIVVVLLGYGFLMTNASIGTDDTAGDMYFTYGYSLRMSRIFMPLLNKFFDVLQFTPFWTEMLAVIFLLCSAWLMVYILEEKLNERISTILGTGFVCVFISYSLINEIFIYSYMSVSIGLGYLLTVVSILFFNISQKTGEKKPVFYSVILMLISISLYESFVTVFFCVIGIELYIECWNKKIKFKDIFKYGLYAVGICMSAVIFERLIAKLCIVIWNLESLNVPSNTYIVWLQNDLLFSIKSVMKTLFYDQFIAGFEYLPILFWVITILVLAIGTIAKVIKNKNYLLILLFFWILVSAEMIIMLQGQTFYRSCQAFGIIVAFGIAFVGRFFADRGKNTIVISIFAVVVMVQTQDLSNWFYLKYRRHEVETNLISSLVIDMKRDGLYGKKIAFIYDDVIEEFGYYGNYVSISEDSYLRRGVNSLVAKTAFLNTPEFIYELNRRHNQTNSVITYLQYGINAFQNSPMGPNYELKKLLKEFFFDFEQVTWEEWEEAKGSVKELEAYPSDLYYIETEDFYVVKIGI